MGGIRLAQITLGQILHTEAVEPLKTTDGALNVALTGQLERFADQLTVPAGSFAIATQIFPAIDYARISLMGYRHAGSGAWTVDVRPIIPIGATGLGLDPFVVGETNTDRVVTDVADIPSSHVRIVIENRNPNASGTYSVWGVLRA